MGGKQKRAAKYKKWMESQNLLKKASSQGDISSDGTIHDGSGDHFSEFQPIPYAVQQEILKSRAKKSRKLRKTNWILLFHSHFTTGKFDSIGRTFNHWPSWTCAVLFGILLVTLIFVLIRSVVQMFVPSEAASVDRSALYNGLRMAVPSPLFKFIRVVDYLFTSPTLSLQGLNRIVYPPEEYQRHRIHS